MKLKGPIEQQALLEAVLKGMTYRALAKRLGVSKSTIGFWIHEADEIPYDKVLCLDELLKKRQEKEMVTVAEDFFGLKEGDSGISFSQCFNAKITRENLNNSEICLNQKLEEAEAKFHLPLRSSLALLLLRSCDRHGEFKLNPHALKEEILPYIEMDFAPIINTLCDLGVIEKFNYQGEWYGQITLEEPVTHKKHKQPYH